MTGANRRAMLLGVLGLGLSSAFPGGSGLGERDAA